MILEHALLHIDVERAVDFEAVFAEASQVIGSASGFQRARLLRGIESPGTYLLLVEWESLEAHVQGFRESPAFGRWRELIGPYFASPPEVEHFTPQATAPA